MLSKDQGWMITIQCDWEECLATDGGQAWVTFKQPGRPAVHDKLRRAGGSLVAAADLFTARLLGPGLLEVAHVETQAAVRCVAPASCLPDLVSGASVTSVDVAAGGLGVATGDRGQLSVWDAASGEVRRRLEGHLGEVYSARLFPSGVVALSTGADMRVKIWSAATGECPVTLTGHTAPVTHSAIVSRGKNIITVSKDGCARLWSCGERKCLGLLLSPGPDTLPDQLTCCDLTDQSHLHPLDPASSAGDEELNSPEVETEDKVLAVGAESGRVTILAVASRAVLQQYEAGAAVSCVAWSPGQLTVGCEDGAVHQLTGSGAAVTRSSSSPVRSVRYIPQLRAVAVARQDGTVSLDTGSAAVLLTGPDTDPVYSLASDQHHLYTGCRDGVVRKYDINIIRNLK